MNGTEVKNVQNYKKAAAIIACLLALAGGWYIFAGRNDVSDIGRRADEARNELESAREEQRDQAESLDRAAEATDRSQQAVRDSQGTADRVQEIDRSDTEIIRECQSILETVRARGKTEN